MSTLIAIRFALNNQSIFDRTDTFFVVGSCENLGKWNTSNGIQLNYFPPFWITQPIFISAASEFEYQFVRNTQWEGNYYAHNRRWRVELENEIVLLCDWKNYGNLVKVVLEPNLDRFSFVLSTWQPQPLQSETLLSFGSVYTRQINTLADFQQEIRNDFSFVYTQWKGNCFFHVVQTAETLIRDFGVSESNLYVVHGLDPLNVQHYALVARSGPMLILYDSLDRKAIRGICDRVGGSGNCIWLENSFLDSKRRGTWNLDGSFPYSKSILEDMAIRSLFPNGSWEFHTKLKSDSGELTVYTDSASWKKKDKTVNFNLSNIPTELKKDTLTDVLEAMKNIWKLNIRIRYSHSGYLFDEFLLAID